MKSIFFYVVINFLFHTSMCLADDVYSFEQLELVRKHIAKNENLKILDDQLVDDFALIILSSGFSFELIEPRLNAFIKNGDKVFNALNKAISAKKDDLWREERVKRLSKIRDATWTKLESLGLKDSKLQVAQSLYAFCIESWKDKEIRHERFSPIICSPFDAYDHMRHFSHSVSLRTEPSSKNNAQVKAYQSLVLAGKEVIKSENLSDLEILMMAKCIGENSAKFMRPTKYPLTACHESLKTRSRSPEKALFQEKGVCSNTSGITYNMAKALGFSRPLFLARHHLHVFLESQVDGEWFHLHPLSRSKKSCDFIRFKEL